MALLVFPIGYLTLRAVTKLAWPAIAGIMAWVTVGAWQGSVALANIAGVAMVALAYVTSVMLYPRTDCSWCGGNGKVVRDGHNHRFCWRCDGSGHVLRFGSRLRSRYRN